MGFMDKVLSKAQEVGKAAQAKMAAAATPAAPTAVPGEGVRAVNMPVGRAGVERQYVPGTPAPAGLYPEGVFALDALGYPQLSDVFGVPIRADGTEADRQELEGVGVHYPSPDDPRYWTGGMEPPW